jgi:(4S)-4-hydroxy-5-phosphonooxypentane-2,3-dione isomerase
MIERYVKMTFKPECADEFVKIFRTNRDRIAAFRGCSHLELQHSEAEPFVFTTFSIWDKTESLDAYRDSELFREIWSRVKPMFAKKPEAVSIKKD